MAANDVRFGRRKRVLITGSNGNLGHKLATHLLETRQFDLYLVDVHKESLLKYTETFPYVEYVQADLTKQDSTWMRKLRRTDVVVHFAAVNPYPNASWTDSSLSLDITFNVFIQAALANVKRVVLASSQHVLGGHKDDNGVNLSSDKSNLLTEASPLSVGSHWVAGGHLIDSTAYAVPKVAAERLAVSLSQAYPSTSFVAVRIGWCQPGENQASTLTSLGAPQECLAGGFEEIPGLSEPGSGNPLDDPAVLQQWFKNMWLSNRDFCSLFRCCIDSKLPDSQKGFLLVNGTSANKSSRWDLSKAQEVLGYKPVDDASS